MIRLLKEYYPAAALIFLSCFLAHGLTLLNDGMVWDGWIFQTLAAEGDFHTMYQAYKAEGYPVLGLYLIFPAALGGGGFLYRLLCFALLSLGSWLMFCICLRSKIFSYIESLFIAVFYAVHPELVATLSITWLTVMITDTLFLCAVFLLIDRDQRQRFLWKKQLPILGLFLLAYDWRPLCSLFFGFLLLLWINSPERERAREKTRDVFHAALAFTKRYAAFIIAPFLFHIANKIIFPYEGPAVYRNRLRPHKLVINFIDYVKIGFVDLFDAALRITFQNTFYILLLLAFVGLAVFWFTRKPFLKDRPKKSEATGFLFFIGWCIFFFAVATFILTSKRPSIDDISIYYLVQTRFPLAWLIVVATRMFKDKFPIKWHQGARVGIFATLLFSLGLFSFVKHATYFKRWIKDQAIITHLITAPAAERFSFYWISDKSGIGPTEPYKFYEWSALFHRAFGNYSRIGITDNKGEWPFYKPDSIYHTREYLLDEFDSLGCQAHLQIFPGPAAQNNKSLILDYLKARYVSRGDVEDYLQTVVAIFVTQYPSAVATHCQEQDS